MLFTFDFGLQTKEVQTLDDKKSIHRQLDYSILKSYNDTIPVEDFGRTIKAGGCVINLQFNLMYIYFLCSRFIRNLNRIGDTPRI